MTWKTGAIRLELNGPGIRELLKSDGVAADIHERAERVATAANERYAAIDVGARDKGQSGGGETHIKATVDKTPGKNRARARVVADHPAARAVEARHRVLGQSTDAAR